MQCFKSGLVKFFILCVSHISNNSLFYLLNTCIRLKFLTFNFGTSLKIVVGVQNGAISRAWARLVSIHCGNIATLFSRAI